MAHYRESAVLAADGRPVLVATDPPYRTGGSGRRFVNYQNAAIRLGPNAALLPQLDVLRARARGLYRNSQLVWGAVEKLVANLVGWGASPKSQHASAAVQGAIEGVWRDWSRQVKFNAIQKRAAREFVVAGEVFLRIRQRRRTDTDALGRRLVVPLELQLIEAEHCPTWYDAPLDGGGYIRAGIQVDGIGRRTAYWMYPQHPGDGASFRMASDLELVAVPASEVIHLYDPESPEQIRGTPRLSRASLAAADLDAFTDATLQRQAIASLFAGFIRRPEGTGGDPMLGESPSNPEPTLEPGTLSYLAEGEEITFPTTPDVGANFEPFVETNHRTLAGGIGVTYEQLSNDLTGVNYSSIRAGSLEFRRACQVWQYTTFVPEFLEPVWVSFLRRAQLAGAIDVPGLLADFIGAGRVEWIMQGWEWVDPLKEVQAATESVLAGFDTRRGVNMARGNDPIRLEDERKAEVERAKELGLTYSTDVAVAAPQPPAATQPGSAGAVQPPRRRQAPGAP